MKRSFWIVMVVGSGLVAVGCSGGEPEFELLPIRDALRSTPAALARLSAAQRTRLAERLSEQPELDDLRVEPTAVVEAIEAGDAQLASGDRDAWLFAVVATDAEGTHYRALNAHAADAPLRLPLDNIEEELEQTGLDTRGGRLLAGLARLAGVTVVRLERAPAQPAAAVLHGATIYVNPAWLVALAEGEAPASASASAVGSGGPPRGQRVSSAPSSPSAPPALDGLGEKHSDILIEALVGYYAIDSIQKSIDSSCQHCEDNCQSYCDRQCDNACDNTLKCEVSKAHQRRATGGEILVMFLSLVALPVLHRWRTWRRGPEVT